MMEQMGQKASDLLVDDDNWTMLSSKWHSLSFFPFLVEQSNLDVYINFKVTYFGETQRLCILQDNVSIAPPWLVAISYSLSCHSGPIQLVAKSNILLKGPN